MIVRANSYLDATRVSLLPKVKRGDMSASHGFLTDPRSEPASLLCMLRARPFDRLTERGV